jgi:hypothetical protein
VNACADSLKRPGLFVYSYREALALQPSRCSRASKSSSNDCNASIAPHLRHSPKSRRRTAFLCVEEQLLRLYYGRPFKQR